MSVLKIHLTYQCTAACAHCRFRCDQKPAEVIDFDVAMSCIRTLKRINNLDYVVLLGGEPGLYPELTHNLVKSIRDLDIGARVETNASWATDVDAARVFLEPLYASGASVMFSLDAFHAPFIPLERLICALQVSKELGGDFVLETAYIDMAQRSHRLDQKTDALYAEVEQALGWLPRGYRGTMLYNGRAADALAQYYSDGKGIPSDLCTAVPWWSDGDLRTLDLLMLDPQGYISKGCGIAIGNVHTTPLKTMLAGYDAEQNPVFKVLLEQGPVGLARLAEQYGYSIKENYADKCQLCQEARDVLFPHWPEYLQPPQHYRH